MKKWKLFCGGLAAVAGLTPSTWAQTLPAVPTIPSPQAAAAGLPSAAATVAPSPGGPTLCSFLGLSAAQKDACRLMLCQLPIGQLLSNTMAPFNALSGGMLGSLCPTVNPADLLKDPTSPEGAAAQIKASAAGAAKRRAALRYLGTVDCTWFPEAEAALIKGLREDPIECVRYEAALALSRGCCCTKKTIAALTETVEGGKKLGPPERSERVKEAALASLEHCLACVPKEDVPPRAKDVVPPRPPDAPAPPPANLPNNVGKANTAEGVQPVYYAEIEATSMSQLRERARQAVVHKVAEENSATSHGRVDRSLYSILVNARQGSSRNAGIHTTEVVAAGNQPVIVESKPTMQPPLAPATAKTVDGVWPMTRPVTPAVDTQSRKSTDDARTGKIIFTAELNTVPVQKALPHPVVVAVNPAPGNTRQPETTSVYPSVPTTRVAQAGFKPPAAALRAQDDISIMREWLPNLRRWDHPELRERAAMNLQRVDWRAYPEVVDGLVAAAISDAASSVRIACIRSLVKMNVRTPEVQSAMEKLKSDRDPLVRDTALTAVAKLK